MDIAVNVIIYLVSIPSLFVDIYMTYLFVKTAACFNNLLYQEMRTKSCLLNVGLMIIAIECIVNTLYKNIYKNTIFCYFALKYETDD